ncbi:MAG: helix-hairpin-helix domain-containing protein [Lachnospiraceae bacterium]|nr:helix-hairpin-helix domain-containing protein [Lachnospiraceae bacterium]
MQKKISKIIFAGMLIILAGCSTDRAYSIDELTGSETAADPSSDITQVADADDSAQTDKAAGNEEDDPRTLCVHVCGAVAVEGVYELPDGSRAEDALKAAGGFTEDADRSYVNLASFLTDGQKLRFPTTEEMDSGQFQKDTGGTGAAGPVNINTASAEELMTLPGIGKTKAEAIIAFRSSGGRFNDKEDIKLISGIGEALYGRIEDLISVR